MSTPAGRTRTHRGSGITRTCAVAAVLVALLSLVGTLVTGTAPASAYWNLSGSTAGTATTSALSAPVGVAVPETATADVPVSWAPGENGVQPEGYYVVRDGGGTTAPACGSSPTSLLVGNDCIDEAVSVGEYTYVVTAVYATWTAHSAPSTTVTVTATVLLGAAQSYSVLAATAVVSTGTTTVSGDALPPTVGIDGGPAAVTKDTTPAITGVSGAAQGSPVSVTVDGQSLSTTVTADGTWAVTAAELSAGRYEITARVRDANGNGAAVSQDLTVEVNPPAIDLAAAATYSVLAATGVVNVGATTMSGDLGVSPATLVTGFPPGTFGGALHAGDLAAAGAQEDLLAALDEASSRAPHTEIVGDLGGQVFHAGVHHQTAALAVTGTVTLDGEGDPGAVFIFVGDAALDTEAASNVSLINGAQPENVFWVVAGAIGTGANSSMSGALLARGAITLGVDTALTGQALSRDAVTIADSALAGVAPALSARVASSAAPQAESVEPEPSAVLPEAPDVQDPAEPSAPSGVSETSDETVPSNEVVVPEETDGSATSDGADDTTPPEEGVPSEEQVEPAEQVESAEQDAVARDPADEAIHDEGTVTP